MSYSQQYLDDMVGIIQQIDPETLEQMARQIATLRERGGRLFFVGSGGGAGHASHAVNDFRKIACIECYTPTDNVSELTARINDDGWDTAYANWLRGSRFNSKDGLFVFSVGGGNLEKNISANLVQAMKLAQEVGADIWGIVGRDGGYTGQVATSCIIVPTARPETVTPQTEAFQAVFWHLLVSHPALQAAEMKWESTR